MLYATQTLAIEKKTIPITECNEEECAMQMGDEATYNGVLVATPRYLTKEADLAAYRFMLANPPPCVAKTDYEEIITIGIFSFSLGALAAIFVAK